MRDPVICVYCGSNEGSDRSYREAAKAASLALTSRGAGIVYGGGMHGLMGEVAAVVLAAGLPLTGVVPRRFHSDRSVPPEGARYIFVETMQERKETMRTLADGFIALPGGIGTLEKCGTLMRRSLGVHDNPLALRNVGGFFDPLVEFMRSMTRAGFMKLSLYESVRVSDNPGALVDDLLGRLPDISPRGLRARE